MNKIELLEFLADNLEISLETTNEYYGSYITVKLILDGIVISTDTTSIKND